MVQARRSSSSSVPDSEPAAGQEEESPAGRGAGDGSHRRNRRRVLTFTISGLCGLFVVAMFAWFIVQAGMFEDIAGPVADSGPTEDSPPVSAEESVLSGPVFTGFDRQKQPYSVSARQAKRDETNPEIIHLDEVKGELKLRDSGDLITLTASNGVYSSETKKLDLLGNVEMTSTGRYSARTREAKVDMARKHLRSEHPMVVVFSAGTVKSNGVELWNAGERILFFNGVRLHIPPQEGKAR